MSRLLGGWINDDILSFPRKGIHESTTKVRMYSVNNLTIVVVRQFLKE